MFLASVLAFWVYARFGVAFLRPVAVTLAAAVPFLFLLLAFWVLPAADMTYDSLPVKVVLFPFREAILSTQIDGVVVKVDSFAKGRVEIVGLRVDEGGDFRDGEAVTLVVRPECIRILGADETAPEGTALHGVIENYSSFKCPDCGKEHALFGESRVEQVAAELGLKVLVKLPIDPGLAAACDGGRVEFYQPNPLAPVAEALDR